jgi:hypothetical protein
VNTDIRPVRRIAGFVAQVNGQCFYDAIVENISIVNNYVAVRSAFQPYEELQRLCGASW